MFTSPYQLPRHLLIIALAAITHTGCLGEPSVLPSSSPSQAADIELSEGDTPSPLGQFGGSLGESCDAQAPCRPGLICADGACEATGDRPLGSTCFIGAECEPGLVCGIAGRCQQEGESAAGGPCAVAEDCKGGYSCEYVGFLGTCAAAGVGDVFQACSHSDQCQPGLVCDSADGICAHPSALVAKWLAARTCPADEGPPRAWFEVPRGQVSEFYRLPFPNDIRRTAGRLDLSGHATLPDSLFGFDPVGRLIDAIEQDTQGYSTAGHVLLRMTQEIDVSSVVNGKDAEGSPAVDTVALVDITPGSPQYGERLPLAWSVLTGPGSAGRYICENWISIRPLWVRPLRPGTTYAALLLKGIRTADGQNFGRDSDFSAVLGGNQPTDSALAGAWQAYAPLRAFVADGQVPLSISADRILSAAVFTTADARPTLEAVRDAVDVADLPMPQQIVRCEAGVQSPCEAVGVGGACVAEGPDFIELHGRYLTPVFQAGKPPYLEPEDGGAFEWTASGAPKVQRYEPVCFALSIPKGVPMPEDGWPVLLFAHGTGGRFRSPMQNGLSAALAKASANDGTAAWAVLSTDQVMHGDRDGGSGLPPEILFFNLGNPRGALGNALQGAADGFQVERLALTLQFDAASSPTGEAVRFDPSQMWFMGHSQGSATGLAYVAQSKRVRGVILSGAGAGLSLSLLHKTKPTNVAAALGFGLGDVKPNGESRVADNHPVLGLIQHYFHVIDPIAHADYLVREPGEAYLPKHVLHIWGIGDNFTPDPTIKALAGAARLVQAKPIDDPLPGAPQLDPPIKTTHAIATAVVASWAPDGDYDGHFVAFRHPGALRQLVQFLATAVTGDHEPTLVP